MSSSPSICAMALLSGQYITFYFGPSADLWYLQAYEMYTIGVLANITKIDSLYWSYHDSDSNIEEATGEYQTSVDFEIDSNDETLSKMVSLLELLEYDDTETFKTLFNGMMADIDSNIYITKVDASQIANDSASWYGYLAQEGEFAEGSNMAVGHGVLYTMSTSSTPQTFCNNTVCTVYTHIPSFSENEKYALCNQWGWAETQVACRTVCNICV